jgi:hypothetical protein
MKTTTTLKAGTTAVVAALTRTVEDLAAKYEAAPSKARLAQFSEAKRELLEAREGRW